MIPSHERDRRTPWPLLFALMLLAAGGIVGCAQLNEFLAPPPPKVMGQWSTLLQELREFERRIGFRDTNNFTKVSTELTSYTFCGRASNRHLPYSYQDARIEWPEIEQEEVCRSVAADMDVYFGKVEAWGEIGTPITAAMLAGTLDRFVYLVIHEDCHDQFELPYGIEEPLCDIITHRAMAEFSGAKYRWNAVEHRSIKHYTRMESRNVRATISHYDQAESLYARFERGEISHVNLLDLRARLFARAERALNLQAGQLNNISLANYMTYSRHYPALERIAVEWRNDLRGMIQFFRLVDARKPSTEDVLKRSGAKDDKQPQFLRAYEAAVLDTIRRTAEAR